MELCLGTVQFGMDYGILNTPMPDIDKSITCLDYATQNGINAIDTATAYGKAEEIVGMFLRKKTINRNNLWISTKFRPNTLDDVNPSDYKKVIKDNIINSLRTLNTDYVDAYYLHSARYAFNDEILDALYKVKEEGLACKVGVSIYEPEEAFACFDSKYVDIIQLPYSIFDHRMKEKGVFASDKRCHIDSRSAFIQGLIMMDKDEVPPFLEKAKPILSQIKKICTETGLNSIELAMAYVKREKAISHLVFGVDSLEQLKSDIEIFNNIDVSSDLLKCIEEEFNGIEAEIVMPSLWKK